MVELTIILDPETHSIRVIGAVHDKLLAMGMLEVAKETILDHHKKKAEARVELATPGDVPPFKID